ncbi:YihY/virulence factor BrkB family protein [Allofustis seminis]|uniref:YihY/virulence factor BrkB family protein n=1 Tax=Allofustis seminis TaxID=166939 RepID=UPI0014616A28|nr:YihY/virulence factor BrkB family protein [Allofustis seminis]
MKKYINQLLKNEKIFNAIQIIRSNWTRADAMQSAGKMAYFLLLSVVPILLLIANVIPLFPIDSDVVLSLMKQALPADIHKIVAPILLNYLHNGSGSGTISFALITTMWSASRVFSTLQTVLNGVYGTAAEKNYISAQIISFLVMVALLLLMILSMTIFLFGESFLHFASRFLPIELPLITSFLFWRWIIIIVFLFGFFMIIYHVVPNHHLKLASAIPGAIFSMIGWLLLAEFFSLYTNVASSEMLANATIGGFIVFMLFLYFLNVILLLGAMLNAMVFEWRTGQSVTTYESNIQKQKKKEALGWSGYPEDDVTLLRGVLHKIPYENN